MNFNLSLIANQVRFGIQNSMSPNAKFTGKSTINRNGNHRLGGRGSFTLCDTFGSSPFPSAVTHPQETDHLCGSLGKLHPPKGLAS
ncbi:hypothetical protein JTE90_011771 [Oedothorax gibbosus]|uniref:Uncharacterized protein n=1 Tax=Oedothorax gibbosus TaxID=931172 RepID=A0AAV6VST6_9ARAC|nr:hypothetical protein JTE90_011771 [Oedothorax gibbosus]